MTNIYCTFVTRWCILLMWSWQIQRLVGLCFSRTVGFAVDVHLSYWHRTGYWLIKRADVKELTPCQERMRMQGDQLPGNLETLESLTAAVGELWGDWTEIMEELWKKSCHGKLLISDFTTRVAAVFVKLFQVTSCYLFEGFCCLSNHVERFCRICTDIYSILVTLALAVCGWP